MHTDLLTHLQVRQVIGETLFPWVDVQSSAWLSGYMIPCDSDDKSRITYQFRRKPVED